MLIGDQWKAGLNKSASVTARRVTEMSAAKRTGNKFAASTGDSKHSEMKIAPRQRRARVTIEAILDATSDLLVEQGVENLSTNMICERAGLTPPALYRYFPNKYAVLKELAVRLKNLQYEIFRDWLERSGASIFQSGKKLDYDAVVSGIYEILTAIYSATKDNPANLWVGRIIRTQPAMAELRTESRANSWHLLKKHLGAQTYGTSYEDVFVAGRVALDLIHATIDMVTEDDGLDQHLAFNSVANMIASEYIRLFNEDRSTMKAAAE